MPLKNLPAQSYQRARCLRLTPGCPLKPLQETLTQGQGAAALPTTCPVEGPSDLVRPCIKVSMRPVGDSISDRHGCIRRLTIAPDRDMLDLQAHLIRILGMAS
jgi:hypothetical protein